MCLTGSSQALFSSHAVTERYHVSDDPAGKIKEVDYRGIVTMGPGRQLGRCILAVYHLHLQKFHNLKHAWSHSTPLSLVSLLYTVEFLIMHIA